MERKLVEVIKELGVNSKVNENLTVGDIATGKVLSPAGEVLHLVRNAYRQQIEDTYFDKFTKQDNGQFTMPIAIDEETNEIVYASVALTISSKQDWSKIERNRKTKTKVVQAVPKLKL